MFNNDFDIEKASIFLRYLAKNTLRTSEKKVDSKINEKIKILSKKVQDLIEGQENKKILLEKEKQILKKKSDFKRSIEQDFLLIKKKLNEAKDNNEDPERFFFLVEKAENLKKKLTQL
jgi:hypothetical protein